MTTYTFSAFSEDELLAAGSGNGSNLGIGDSFTMPATPDTEITVEDDDAYLSGDSWSNEKANDSTGQTATITDASGAELGNEGQIYAEKYFWVSDQNGNWYVMIEIEQEGSSDDYFSFYEGCGYSTPPEGAELTIHSSCNVTSDWISMNSLDAGEITPPVGWVSGRLTFDADGNDNEWNAETGQWDGGVDGVTVELVDLDGNVVATTTTTSTGNYIFDAPPGEYRVQFPQLDGYEFSAQDSGVAEHYDSDADANGLTNVITVTAGQNTNNIDAGLKLAPVLDAVDDMIVVDENEAAGDSDINVLANDTNEFGGANKVLKVEGQSANVGEWIDLAGGGRVRLDENGELDFDADGDFDALNDGESATVSLEYSIAEMEVSAEDYQCLFFNEFAAGTVITDQLSGAGVTISSANGSNPVMIFDTANTTGGDYDLATSNLGKVLILSEDGDSNDPDDNAGGGTFVFDFDRPAELNGLSFLDTEEPGAEIRMYDEGGNLIQTIQGPTTANGGQASIDFDVSGVARMEVELQGSGAIDNLIYTLPGEETVVAEDSATVTIQVNGIDDPVIENQAPDAVDDAFVTDEATTITGNVLANDSDPDGDPISVVAVEGGAVGEGIQVTTANGHTGTVTVSADGSFSFDPDENFKDMAAGEQDSFELTYTISDDPSAVAKQNLLFVLDVSNSTVGQTGDAEDNFDGVGVGDVNGDGLSDTVLDAEIAAVVSAVNNLLATGIDPSLVDVGVVTFSGLVDLSRFSAPFNTPTEDATTVGTWQLDEAALIAELNAIQSGGWTNYEAGLQEAEAWLAANADAGEANSVYFLSDGRPVIDKVNGNDVLQSMADYGDEVARISNDYGADIHAIGIGANSDLQYLNDIDNTDGAEQVLDSNALTVLLEGIVVAPQMDTATITVTINGLNEGPTATDNAAVTDEETAVTGNVLTDDDGAGVDSDPDGDTLTVSAVSFGAVGSAASVSTDSGNFTGQLIVGADGSYTFTPDAGLDALAVGDQETVTFTYTIEDGNGGSDTATVTITIDGLNEPPEAIDDVAVIAEGGAIGFGDTETPLNVLDNDSDPNGDSLTVVSAGGQPAGATLNLVTAGGVPITVTVAADGSVEFDTSGAFDDLNDGESDSFTLSYVVDDGNGGQDTAEVVVSILGETQNLPPEALNDAVTIGEADVVGSGAAEVALNVLDNDSDPDGDMLTVVSAGGQPAGGAVTVTTAGGVDVDVTIAADGTVSFDTAGKFDALNDGDSDSFTLSYVVDDGNGAQDAADVTITIEGEGQVQTGPSYNIVFLVDASNSTGNANSGAAIIGTGGPLDLNGDGVSNSLFDAELNIVQKITDELGVSNPGDDIEIGVLAFNTALTASANNPAQVLTDGNGDSVFGAGSDLSGAFTGVEEQDFGAFNTAIAGANAFLGQTSQNDGAETVNLVYLISDGFGADWTAGGDADLTAELATLIDPLGLNGTAETLILNPFGAFNAGVLEIENTAGDGVAQVLDSENDVDLFVATIGQDLIV